MAKRRPEPEHHSQAQRRDAETNEFRPEQSDEQLYKMVAAVARDVLPDGPEKLGQQQFDENRERIAAALDEPVPPKANAIYMRINRRRGEGERRQWKQIVAHALAGDHERRVTVDTRADAAWFQDEGYLVYSLRRVADHLGVARGAPGVPPDAYDRAYRELLAADRRLRRGGRLHGAVENRAPKFSTAPQTGSAADVPNFRRSPIKGSRGYLRVASSSVVQSDDDCNPRIRSAAASVLASSSSSISSV